MASFKAEGKSSQTYERCLSAVPVVFFLENIRFPKKNSKQREDKVLCIKNRKKPFLISFKTTCPQNEMRKAGLALLQKNRSFSPSFLLISPSRTKAETEAAPTGNPHKSPNKNGMKKQRVPAFCVCFVKRDERTREGKREGRNIRRGTASKARGKERGEKDFVWIWS